LRKLQSTLLLGGAWLAAGPAQAQSYGNHPHGWGGGWGMMLGPVAWLVFMAVAVALVVLLVRWLAGGERGERPSRPARKPLDILEERFARGEIDEEEFRRRKEALVE